MRSNAWPEYVVAVLAACSMEAAWITLAYVIVGGLIARGPAPLSILAFAGATLVGLGIARWSVRDRRHSYRTLIAAIAVAAALIGWLLPLGPGATLGFESPMALIGMNPGGLLLGLAVVRGTAHVTSDDDERIAETALGPGLLVVALAWVLLTATGGHRDSSMVGAAFSATVTFVTAGLLGIGLARSADLRSTGVLGADRRTWVALVFGVVAGLLALAMPLALILGVPIDDAIRGVLGPIAEILVPIVSFLFWPAGLIATAFVLLIELLRGHTPIETSTIGAAGGGAGIDLGLQSGPSSADGLVLGLVPLVIAIVVTFLLARRLLGTPGLSDLESDLNEVRETERPAGRLGLRRPHLRRPRRHPVPHTASEAYLASLEILAQWPDTARLGSETPAEHARRLGADSIRLPLSRLAADYTLAEFGQRTLVPSEHRRAVERWRRLRSLGGP